MPRHTDVPRELASLETADDDHNRQFVTRLPKAEAVYLLRRCLAGRRLPSQVLSDIVTDAARDDLRLRLPPLTRQLLDMASSILGVSLENLAVLILIDAAPAKLKEAVQRQQVWTETLAAAESAWGAK